MAYHIEQVMPSLLEEEILYLRHRDNNTTGQQGEFEVARYLCSQGYHVSEPKVDTGVDWMYFDPKNPRDVKLAQVKEIFRKEYEDVEKYKGEPYFVFQFQSGGGPQKRRHNRESHDVFFHTLLTPHRTLIFKMDSAMIPLKKGTNNFIQNKDARLDRSYTSPMEPQFYFKNFLVSAQYSPKVVEANQSFFNKSTLCKFMN